MIWVIVMITRRFRVDWLIEIEFLDRGVFVRTQNGLSLILFQYSFPSRKRKNLRIAQMKLSLGSNRQNKLNNYGQPFFVGDALSDKRFNTTAQDFGLYSM